ncbi:MAG TPA: hypothetical protein VF129_09260 [Actinomycetota bacterium]
MKPCPFCDAELRDSVIRCTRCGRSLVGEDGPDGRLPEAAAVAPARTSPAAPATWPAPSAPPPRPPALAGPRPGVAPNRPAALRALPTERRRSARVDVALLLAALAGVGAAVLAWQAAHDPWVTLTITDTRDRLDPELVGPLTVVGDASLIGLVGRVVAGVIGAYGLAWLYFGFDRGSTIPWFLSPAVPLLAAVAGMLAVVLSATVWLVWVDAAVPQARTIGLSTRELRALLDLQPAPLVEIERLDGLHRYGGSLLAGLAATITAWWSARKRT